MNCNKRVLTDLKVLANSVAAIMPKKWQPTMSFHYYVGRSENGYYIDTVHRRLYTHTPELMQFISAIQVAQTRAMQRVFKELF